MNDEESVEENCFDTDASVSGEELSFQADSSEREEMSSCPIPGIAPLAQVFPDSDSESVSNLATEALSPLPPHMQNKKPTGGERDLLTPLVTTETSCAKRENEENDKFPRHRFYREGEKEEEIKSPVPTTAPSNLCKTEWTTVGLEYVKSAKTEVVENMKEDMEGNHEARHGSDATTNETMSEGNDSAIARTAASNAWVSTSMGQIPIFCRALRFLR